MNANTVTTARPKKGSKLRTLLLTVVASLLLAGIGGKGFYHYKFPYGYSHACSKGLGLTLRMYAENHDGWLPYGRETPEASLALFAHDDIDSALWVLGGKNVPRVVVQAALTNAWVFGPDTCGWHYVEGLREDDDPQLMVAWDKTVGLNHNGMRTKGLEHEVVFLDGSAQYASSTKWRQLVADEKEKIAKVIISRQSNAPPIRWSDEAELGPNRFPPPRTK